MTLSRICFPNSTSHYVKKFSTNLPRIFSSKFHLSFVSPEMSKNTCLFTLRLVDKTSKCLCSWWQKNLHAAMTTMQLSTVHSELGISQPLVIFYPISDLFLMLIRIILVVAISILFCLENCPLLLLAFLFWQSSNGTRYQMISNQSPSYEFLSVGLEFFISQYD